jgi:RNA polymerase sigma-70 factor (ECF subfamily)
VAEYEFFPQLEWLLSHDEIVAARRRAAEDFVVRQFEDHGRRIARYVRSLGVPWSDVEDILQEVFLALHRQVSLDGPRPHVRGWIFRVAHNLGLKHLRSERRLRLRAFESQFVRRRDADSDPEEQFLENQRREKLVAVLDALPSQDRQCLFLRFEGLRYREISAVLGISLGSVANSLARSLRQLERADEG